MHHLLGPYRPFERLSPATGSASTFTILFAVFAAAATFAEEPIDRQALVGRHRVVLSAADIWSPLSVGNGAFCFTADITGLQTFEAEYAKGMPLGTMADWSWHTTPNTNDYQLEDTLVDVPGAGGHTASYPINTKSPASGWLRANPHQFSVGQIGLVLKKKDGSDAGLMDLHAVDQQLDLWRGLLTSRFELEGTPVTVLTCAHPVEDAVAVRIESPLLANGQLYGKIAFPFPSGSWGKTFNDWKSADGHKTTVVSQSPGRLVLKRELDTTTYACTIAAEGGKIEKTGSHTVAVNPVGGQALEFVVAFSEDCTPSKLTHDFAQNREAAEAGMREFWLSGGAIDLSASTDPRWKELERRIVLSQYLTGIQSRGRTFPQETGLTCNSWHGKFHLEMHWWHSVHFALWGREEALARQLDWYLSVMPVMGATAQRQGYEGVRWGKMLGPDGREAPSGIGPLLVWQQPHPIYYAELLYRVTPSRAVLDKYSEMIEETAAFMADFACWNEDRQCFELGPPFVSAREFAANDHRKNKNGCFELAYWRWGLLAANEWRQRLGKEPNRNWARIAEKLAPLPTKDGVYIEQEEVKVPDGGHPCQLAAWGLLPISPMIDEDTMVRTMDHVLHKWDHRSTWGWDYPMMAMTAARVGRGDWAIECLLLDQTKNTYRANGHNYQGNNLPLYLPGNGGLLTAVAMMAAGWDAATADESGVGSAPGFPKDGRWSVRWEGLRPVP